MSACSFSFDSRVDLQSQPRSGSSALARQRAVLAPLPWARLQSELAAVPGNMHLVSLTDPVSGSSQPLYLLSVRPDVESSWSAVA